METIVEMCTATKGPFMYDVSQVGGGGDSRTFFVAKQV